jgi:hypothetical protein
MTEKKLFSMIEKDINATGGITWAVHVGTTNARFREKTDIFGVFDMIYIMHTGVVGFIQTTTKGHEANRRRKIYNFFNDVGVGMPPNCWLYTWNAKDEGFIKERLS